MIKILHILMFILTVALNSFADESLIKTSEVKAWRLQESVRIDGVLSENIWQSDSCTSHFWQRNPVEGSPATERTEVRIAYDEQALYVGARLYDSHPDSIIAQLSRRDGASNSDVFAFFVDPYHDKLNGYYFAVNAAGSLYDGILMNDDWDDSSWDGVWEGKTSIDRLGWYAEMRIPLSQLRFQNNREGYIWGVNFRRDIIRKKEETFLVFTPKNGSGFVSRFVDLTGLSEIHPSNNIEVLPYFRTKGEFTHPEQGDPFNDGSRLIPAAGADIKIGLSSNLTLNTTINPDFGQVEVDPAVVNLSDVETFFEEKRPFFIEGMSIFKFGKGGSRSHWDFNWSNPQFFYSRRIGRAPQGNLPDSGYDFASSPEGVHILGAAKLSGKIYNDLNIGAIHAVTNREFADLSTIGDKTRHEVEPLTQYSVFRLQKEIKQGFHGIGIIATSAMRDFQNKSLRDEFNSRSFGVGLDGWSFFDQDKEWVISSWAGYSSIYGTKTQMTDLQSGPQHYFQRPDAKSVLLDSNATSLQGIAGRILLNKQKGNVIFNSAIGVVSPGFDVNDLGFMWRTNLINGHLGAGYHWTKPGRIFRDADVIGAVFQSRDFDNNIIWQGIFTLAEMQFLNYYNAEIELAYNPRTYNIYRTRGGPITVNPPGFELGINAGSDSRKPLVIGLRGFTYQLSQIEWERRIELSVEWKPRNNISFNFSPEISWSQDRSMWVDKVENNTDASATETYGKRYVFADMKYIMVAAGIRLNWTFTPKVSFQMYAQPYLSSGDYFNFKYLTRSRSYDFTRFGEENSTLRSEVEDGSHWYYADADGPSGPSPEMSWPEPDFNFGSLRGNAVLRWEYLPGSTLYLVWTQSRSERQEDGGFALRHSFDRMTSAAADNIVMIKLNYWWNF